MDEWHKKQLIEDRDNLLKELRKWDNPEMQFQIKLKIDQIEEELYGHQRNTNP